MQNQKRHSSIKIKIQDNIRSKNNNQRLDKLWRMLFKLLDSDSKGIISCENISTKSNYEKDFQEN